MSVAQPTDGRGLLAGAGVCTMFFDVMKQLYQHPLTDVAIELFLEDWKNVPRDNPA